MFVRCVTPFGDLKPGDTVEVPDGEVNDHFEIVAAADVPPAGPITPPVS